MHRQTFAALAALGLAACASPQIAEPPAGPTSVFRNAQWWTGERFERGDRYVRDGVFVRKPSGGEISEIDLGGGYVSPGFADAHNHLSGAATDAAFFRQGVLYTKNPTIFGSSSARLKAHFARPDTVDAALAMGALTATDGHPVVLYTVTLRQTAFRGVTAEQMYGDAFHVVDRADQIAPALDLLQQHGAEFVKLCLLYSEEFEKRRDDPAFNGRKGLDPALFPEIVKAVHARGWTATVHIETANDFRVAVAAGVDEFAHMPGYAYDGTGDGAVFRLTEADAQAARRAGVRMIATAFVGASAPLPPDRIEKVRALQAHNLKLLKAAGVPLLIGSDGSPAEGAVKEATYLVDIGVFTPKEAFIAWSQTTPQAIFPKRRIGALTPGAEASFVVLEADPTKSAAAFRSVRREIMQGREVTPPPPPPPAPAPAAPAPG